MEKKYLKEGNGSNLFFLQMQSTESSIFIARERETLGIFSLSSFIQGQERGGDGKVTPNIHANDHRSNLHEPFYSHPFPNTRSWLWRTDEKWCSERGLVLI